MIAVELRKLARRPRTWATLFLLDLLPTVVAVLLAVTHLGPRPGQGPAFLSAVLANGSLFSVAALAIVLPLFLPVAVTVIAGDSIAGEAQAGTLRYLLTRPVGRTRLLVAKLIAVLVFVLVAVVVVAGTGYLVGKLLLGGQPLTASTSVGMSPTIASRMSLSVSRPATVPYSLRTTAMIGVAAMALLLSTFSDSPLSASLGALAFLIGSSLLLPLDAARGIAPYLPTRYWLSFIDLFRDPILWRNVERGVLLQLVYVVVLLGAAWANFSSKDITS